MTDARATSRRGFLRGAAGAAAVGAGAGSAAAQEGGKNVTVGPGGELVFDPADLTVEKGTTVTWTWDSDTHNIVVDSQPADANWEGTEGGAGTVYDTGHEYQFTFDVVGTYDYFCAPHKSAGMTGSVEVVEEIETPAPDQGPPPVPESARTLGVATTFALLSTLGLAYVFLKYSGGPATGDEE